MRLGGEKRSQWEEQSRRGAELLSQRIYGRVDMMFPVIAGLDATTQDILSKISHVFIHAHCSGEMLTPKSTGVQIRPRTHVLATRRPPLAWKFWAWARSACWFFWEVCTPELKPQLPKGELFAKH